MIVAISRKSFFSNIGPLSGNNGCSARELQRHPALVPVDERGGRACILPKTQLARGHHVSNLKVRTISPSPQHRDLASSAPPPPPSVPAISARTLSARIANCSMRSTCQPCNTRLPKTRGSNTCDSAGRALRGPSGFCNAATHRHGSNDATIARPQAPMIRCCKIEVLRNAFS